MNAAAIAALIAQLLPLGIQLYNELRAANSSLPPIETILAQADANWDQVIATAQAQLPPATGGPVPPSGGSKN